MMATNMYDWTTNLLCIGNQKEDYTMYMKYGRPP
jgi:hypothetical protein